ncbi:MAG: tRNA dimethylallyltransferase [Parcubacteria group bacterium GW2011_GWC2_39_14]|nr:MAG: tRNA dimethylallyltransferase [Parcubacteria group bacterium GW2011_GWC2_39_14]KKR53143.1 MAG: tRNA dimethylallyltransferase [Parcubacteria group bacterium GW2011_GWA2_40_23]
MKPKIIIIQGPTASGKSAIAIKLAKEFNGFLISADSRMIYKGMDIGTNKDKGKWVANTYIVQGVEEKMIDVVLPDQEFTVDDWVKQVKMIIKEDKRLPVIVGGTGFYTQALVNNFKLPVGKNDELRDKLEKELKEKGIESLVKKIKEIDPDIESKIDIQNPRRVIRAAEICLQTKKPLERQVGRPLYEAFQIGINFDREKLYEKINKRVDEMIEEGLVKEVEGLMKQGFSEKLQSMTGIGYRQVVQYLTGKLSSSDAVELIKRDTRRYAKRQITWLKRDKTINWVNSAKEAQDLIRKFV